MNMKLVTFFSVLLTIFLVNSCAVVKKKNKFIEFRKYDVKKNFLLRYNGYYYFEYVDNSIFSDDEKCIRPILLYKDGIINVQSAASGPSLFIIETFDGIPKNATELSRSYNTFEHAHKSFVINMKMMKGKEKKEVRDWGAYNIVEDTIKIAYYDINRTGSFIPIIPYELIETYGIIQNDTTFVIPDGLTGRKNEVYHFRQYSPKPDSLNATVRSRIFKSKKWPPIYIPLFDYD